MQPSLSLIGFTLLCVVASGYGARPVGIHFDIEPYLLPEGMDAVAGPFITLTQQLRQLTRGITEIRYDVSMGMGFTWNYQDRAIGDWVLENSDGVSIMSYRDRASGPNGMIQMSNSYFEFATGTNKKVFLGVETQYLPGDAPSTFYEEGEDHMEGQLAIVDEYYSSNENYGGLAIHYLDSYQEFIDGSSQPRPANPRAMWVWEGRRVVETPNSLQNLLSLCQEKNINLLYFEAYTILIDGPRDQFSQFIQDAWDQGIKIELLFGERAWARTENHEFVFGLTRTALDYINSLPAGICTTYSATQFSSDNQRQASKSVEAKSKTEVVHDSKNNGARNIVGMAVSIGIFAVVAIVSIIGVISRCKKPKNVVDLPEIDIVDKINMETVQRKRSLTFDEELEIVTEISSRKSSDASVKPLNQ